MIVPWSEEWERLLETEDFGQAQAIEAHDRIITCLGHNLCPACGARDFGPGRWDGPQSGIAAETVACLTCQIVWPPFEVLVTWDFLTIPEAAQMMGTTMRQVSELARSIQKSGEPL